MKNSEGSYALRALYEKPVRLSTGNQRLPPNRCDMMRGQGGFRFSR
jgi:hypothetical protein